MPADYRDFSLPAAILLHLGVKRVRLLSNNPRKAGALGENGIEVVDRLACETAPNAHSLPYLRTKKERMGHTLSLDAPAVRRQDELCVRCDLVGWRTTCPACAKPATELFTLPERRAARLREPEFA
jgi:GTP cyclohydrolase II